MIGRLVTQRRQRPLLPTPVITFLKNEIEFLKVEFL